MTNTRHRESSRVHRSLRLLRKGAVALTGACLALSLSPVTPATAAVQHPTVVSKNPADYTPSLVDTGAAFKPIVDAIGQAGDVMVAGGQFLQLTQGGQTYDRRNLVVFSASTGLVSPVALDPDGRIWAIETIDNWVYVGGEFKNIGGVSRPSLARFDALTGQVDPGFRPPITGRVNTLEAANGRLYVGGSFGAKLLALNPTTGANTKTVALTIADAIPGAWGSVTVHQIAINPQGTRLAATGNFQTVAGQSRVRFFMADLTTSPATLDPWYYTPFSKACSSTHPRRIAYLQGVDFAPDGSYFVVTATGQISKTEDRHITVCDAAARFNLDDDTRPVWINYTGGDSVWATSVTGAAVYVQGHFQWLDNPNGFASKDGGGAARRLGIGAIDPVTGLALAWNPPKRAQIGGKAFLATSAGLWVGSDSELFNQEPRRGIAFAPLP